MACCQIVVLVTLLLNTCLPRYEALTGWGMRYAWAVAVILVWLLSVLARAAASAPKKGEENDGIGNQAKRRFKAGGVA